ncbi:MAG: Hsp20/alpha crystallin family protein [Clostridia bacterium]|nr:Hsp20/alpha crystallin family protein [Clostridia bacterium]
MYNSDNKIDAFDFITSIINALESENSNQINKPIMDVFTRWLNLSKPANTSRDFSALDNYIKNIVDQSVGVYFEQFFKQPQDIVPSLQLPSQTDCQEPFEIAEFEESIHNEIIPAQGHRYEQTPENDLIESVEPLQSPNEASPAIYTVNEPHEPRYTGSVRKIVHLQPEVVDTHSFFIIRLVIPEGINEDEFKIAVNPTHTIIKWDKGYLEQIIQLPPDVLVNKAGASVKNKILEIKIPKKSDEYRKEISILNI